MSNKRQMMTLSGLATARGVVAGSAFIYRGHSELSIPEYVVELGRENDELARVERARSEVRRDLEGLVSVLKERTVREDVMVFECHLMILDDPTLDGAIRRHVAEGRLNAEAAVARAIGESRRQFERMNDSYFRERVRDLDDIEKRLIAALTGRTRNPHLELKSPVIVIADDLTPSEIVQLPSEFVLGFATAGGSATSHVALLARAMGIPAVTGLGDGIGRIKAGATVLLDGMAGSITLDPDEETLRNFNALVDRQNRVKQESIDGSSVGRLADGGNVRICANVHPGVSFDPVRSSGAAGVGLYRSEYLWLDRELEPSEDEQFAAYREVAEFASSLGPDGRAVIRLLDIGGDKTVRGISAKEANPFLGNRSIRYLLSHREVLGTQLRAILRASAYGKVSLLYPMISCVEELREASAALEAEKRRLDECGVAYDRHLPVGVMIEIPSAALNARALARLVDFFSIGTNDLVQYTLAMDRGNEAVAHLYQPLNPAILTLVRGTIAAAKASGISVGVCGESAADPVAGPLWVAMGVDDLSMSAAYIPVVSRVLGRLTRADLEAYRALSESFGPELPGAEVFDRCHRFLKDRIGDLDELIV